MSQLTDSIFVDSVEIQSYLLFNGLSTNEDVVLGDYIVYARTVWARDGSDAVPWTLTARSGGELLWKVEGLSPAPGSATVAYTATVTEYGDSDCSIDTYGELVSMDQE